MNDMYAIEDIREAFFKTFPDIGYVYEGHLQPDEMKKFNLKYWEEFRDAILKVSKANS